MAGGQATRLPVMAMAMRRRLRLLLLLAMTMAMAALSGPPPLARALPPSTVTCGSAGGSGSCTVTNYCGAWADRAPCRFREAVYPRTERELVAAVARAARAGASVRVAAAGAHSFPKLACPRGGEAVLISTRDLNRRIRVDARARTVTADAGVTLRDLVRALDARGMALPHAPVWGGVTVAGMIGTGAHGSSVWGRGGAVHEYAVRVRVVVPADEARGFARVRTVVARNGSLEMAALRVHLGVLGAISQVTLRVQPQFKRSVTYHITSDAELETKLLTLAQEHEFGEANWYPAQKVVRYRLDGRVPVSTPGDGVSETFGHVHAQSMRATRTAELEIERTRNESAQCARAAGALHYLTSTGFGLASNKSSPGVFQGYPVVGLSHDIMTSSGCWDELPEDDAAGEPTQVCLWDLGPKGIFVFNIGVSLPFTKVGAFIRDLRRLAKLRPEAMCSLEAYGGVWMRFVKGTGSALLGLTHDSVDIDITFRRATYAHAPRMHQDVLDEVEQMAVLKHGGAPHWGKGRPATFAGVGGEPETYPGLAHFLRVKRAMDPRGLFSNAWTDAVLGVRGSVARLKPACALEGLCVCSRDEHCAPYAGYFCHPGLVYKQARVCRFEGRRHHAQS